MSTKEAPVKFITNPALEFSAALLILSNGERNIALSDKTGTKPDEKLFEIGRYAIGRYSSFLQKEMHFFMDQDKWSLPHISPVNSLPFSFALKAPGQCTVNELLKRIEAAGEEELLDILGNGALGGNSGKPATKDTFIERINTLPPEDSALRNKLLECLENPSETLKRLSFALKQFYEGVYRHFEAGILSDIEPFREKYVKLYEADPAGFLKDYFSVDMRGHKQLQIHVSFFMQAGILSFQGNSVYPDCFIMGIHSEQRFGSQFTRARLLDFYKLLSDEKRFAILELLAQRPWYVNELAEQLNLAASTVSHHLGFFIRSGLVTLNREDHRQYYTLDAEKTKELLDKSYRLFMKER